MKSKLPVLVVEDDAAINALIGEYLRLEGFEYRPALDGSSAMREALENTPCVVVLDLMLPDTDGFQVCRQLKEHERTALVPVLMLTALNDEESRRHGLACGAAAYLNKPFDPDRLLAEIRQHIRGNGHID